MVILEIRIVERDDPNMQYGINNRSLYKVNYFKDYGYFIDYTTQTFLRDEQTTREQPEYNQKIHISKRDSLFTMIPVMNDGFTDIQVSISVGEMHFFSDFFEGEIPREEFDKFMDLFEDIDVEKNQRLFRQTLISKTDNKITRTLPPELVNEIVKLL